MFISLLIKRCYSYFFYLLNSLALNSRYSLWICSSWYRTLIYDLEDQKRVSACSHCSCEIKPAVVDVFWGGVGGVYQSAKEFLLQLFVMTTTTD